MEAETNTARRREILRQDLEYNGNSKTKSYCKQHRVPTKPVFYIYLVQVIHQKRLSRRVQESDNGQFETLRGRAHSTDGSFNNAENFGVTRFETKLTKLDFACDCNLTIYNKSYHNTIEIF